MRKYKFPPNIRCAAAFSNHPPPLQPKRNMLENFAW